MNKVLIISPYFAPLNTADSHRVRMSLPYFEKFGWQAEVVKVNDIYTDMPIDILLNRTIPTDIKIHEVGAFSKKWTSKFGLGSIALRSLWFYFRYVNKLLRKEKFDLIYFSTTQFPVCILGNYWKKKFNIPYVIDVQDPWHTEYYKSKPKSERPPKYWFSYHLNKWLEPLAMRNVNGLISVSENYISELKFRYPQLQNIPAKVITFGYAQIDFDVATSVKSTAINLSSAYKNVVYIGAVGHIMKKSLMILFASLKTIKSNYPEIYNKLKFNFIGTSYAPKDKGYPTVIPIAINYGVADCVTEQTNRIGYFEALSLLRNADGLLVLGSDDENYSASKIYPYLSVNKPLMAIYNSNSEVFKMLKKFNASTLIPTNAEENQHLNVLNFINQLLNDTKEVVPTNQKEFEKYSAEQLSKEQTDLFNQAIKS